MIEIVIIVFPVLFGGVLSSRTIEIGEMCMYVMNVSTTSGAIPRSQTPLIRCKYSCVEPIIPIRSGGMSFI
jgi:hypothetical protein